MKKLILFLLAAVSAVSVSAIEKTKCYLSHEGAMTVFDGSMLTTAIDEAVQGDTIYLQEGSYTGFTLDREITIRGVGPCGTLITSDITINIPGSPALTQTLLEGLCLCPSSSSHYSITLNGPMTGVKIKQCNFYNFYVTVENDGIVLDRCTIMGHLNQSSYIKDLTVSNSRITRIVPNGNIQDACKYINCNIYAFYRYGNSSTYINGHFVNCIVYSPADGVSTSYIPYLKDCVCINTLRMNDWNLNSGNVIENCYYDTTYKLESTTSELLTYSYDDLYNAGYVGNDGSVVGCYGGTAPFSEELSIPKILSSELYYDKDAKILEVTIQATAK